MKKLTLIFLMVIATMAQASEPVKLNKNLKAGLCFSGGMIVIGSAIKIAQTTKPTPVVYNYEFEKRKNQNNRLANFFFIGAGVSLFTVSFTF